MNLLSKYLTRLHLTCLYWLVPLAVLGFSHQGQTAAAFQAFIGEEVVLGRYDETRYDPVSRHCVALQAPALTIEQNPVRGTLSVQRSEDEAITHPQCPGLRGPIVMLRYRANGEGAGYDEVSWRVIYQAAQLGSPVYRAQIEVLEQQ